MQKLSNIYIKTTKEIYSIFIALLVMISLSYALVPEESFASQYKERMFDTKELRSKRLRAFSKWLEMLNRYKEELSNGENSFKCSIPKKIADVNNVAKILGADINANAATINEGYGDNKNNSDYICRENLWTKVNLLPKNSGLLGKLQLINKVINEEKYIIDPINWNMADYWATPNQFSIKDGDCEDYAISKYMLLKAMGFPKENMRIVILNDQNLEILHAILAVYSEDGKIYILDNQISAVLEDKDIHHYKPIYSINEFYWWKHR